MNRDTESAECLHGMHGQCVYEDCACICHLLEHLQEEGAASYEIAEEDCYRDV